MLSRASTLLVTDIQPIGVQWDTNMPSNVNIHSWRRLQLRGCIAECTAETLKSLRMDYLTHPEPMATMYF